LDRNFRERLEQERRYAKKGANVSNRSADFSTTQETRDAPDGKAEFENSRERFD
jgi:hypothetical protein